MNARTAETLMRCHRPGRHADSRTEKAVRFAEQDPELGKMLREQFTFDEQIVEAIHHIQPPDNLGQKLSELRSPPGAEKKSRLRRHIINPAVLTAVHGAQLLGGVIVFLIMERMEKFPGRESVEGLLGTAAKMSGHELETVSMTTSQIGDWLYMKGYEGYEAPAELAGQPVMGSRVFRYDGRSVAQVAVGSVDELSYLLYDFQASEFGVQLPPDGDWLVMARDQWVGAIRQRGDHCVLIAFRGDKTGMREFLKGLPKK